MRLVLRSWSVSSTPAAGRIPAKRARLTERNSKHSSRRRRPFSDPSILTSENMTEQPEIEPEKLAASLQYASERAKTTGRPYLVTGMAHAFLDTKSNRAIAEECGGIAFATLLETERL